MKSTVSADYLFVTASLVFAIVRLVSDSQPIEPVTFAVTHAEDAHPQYIRIFNLPDGQRDILFRRPSSWDDDPNGPIRILNSSDGMEVIVLPHK